MPQKKFTTEFIFGKQIFGGGGVGGPPGGRAGSEKDTLLPLTIRDSWWGMPNNMGVKISLAEISFSINVPRS